LEIEESPVGGGTLPQNEFRIKFNAMFLEQSKEFFFETHLAMVFFLRVNVFDHRRDVR